LGDATTFTAVHEAPANSEPAGPIQSQQHAEGDYWFNSWRLFESLGPWKFETATGLTHPLVTRGSSVALGYSDIFETGCNPERGGHGPSVLFRHDFGK
jgi:hypothetical protein